MKVKTATFDSIPYPKQMNRCESIHTVSTGVSRKFSGCDKQRHRKLHVDNVEVWNRGGIFLSPIVIGCQDHCELLQKAPMSGVCIVYLGNNIHYKLWRPFVKCKCEKASVCVSYQCIILCVNPRTSSPENFPYTDVSPQILPSIFVSTGHPPSVPD